MRQVFSTFDKNGDGRLNLAELREGIKKIKGAGLTDAEVEQAFKTLDSNKNGYIDYTEFIAGCLQSYNYLNEQHLKSAFAYFDKDQNGTITIEELKQSLQTANFSLPDASIQRILREVDIDNDGVVSVL